MARAKLPVSQRKQRQAGGAGPVSGGPPEVFDRDWILRVANTAEADLRAHLVAVTYHHYLNELDARIFGDDAVRARLKQQLTVRVCNANWFAFATWATVTLSREIRNERAPLRSERLLTHGLRERLTPAIVHLRAADGQRVSRALSWGQRSVFLSTTSAMLDLMHGTLAPDEGLLYELTRSARWDDTSDLDATRHLEVVAEAFSVYQKAAAITQELRKQRCERRSTLETRRARYVLQANLMLTAVEQDVVDDAVSVVVDHVPQLAMARLDARVARWGERLLGIPRQLTGLQLPFRLQDARDMARSSWARLMTDQLLVMSLPTETLRLGRDLPPRDPSQPFLPAQLRRLDVLEGADRVKHPDEVADNEVIARLVRTFDRSRGDGVGTGAHDWRRYDDRMNWAVNLLRSRQQDPTLFWCPYSQEDQRRLLRFELPARVGDPGDLEVQAPLDGFAMRHATPDPGGDYGHA